MRTSVPTITRVDVPVTRLAEGPVWDVEDQALYYVDAAGGTLNRYDPETGGHRSWDFPGRVACLAVRRSGGVLLALDTGLHLFDLDSGELVSIGDPQAGQPHLTLNDGKVDARGRFVCGSVDTRLDHADASLFSVDAGTIRVLDIGFTVANGPCWSPDGGTLYHAESWRKTIHAYDYDLDTGTVRNRRDFASTEDLGGIPDGATVDTDGYLWSAICEGGVVARFAPDGRLDRTVQMPTSWVSSVMFGGPGLDRLFVTSIDPRTFGRDAVPGGGELYVVDGLGVRGLPEPRYAG